MKATSISFKGSCDGAPYDFPGAEQVGGGNGEDVGKGMQEAAEEHTKWLQANSNLKIIATTFRRKKARTTTHPDFLIEVLYWSE